MATGTEGANDMEKPLDLLTVIDTIPALVVCALPDGTVEFVNRTWREYTGCALEQLTGRGWQTVIHPDDITKFMEEWNAAREAGKPFENEVRVRRADGEFRWFLIKKVPQRDTSEQIVRWYGAGYDIDDRKKGEERAERNERELRTIIETIPAFVGTAEPDGSVDFISQRWLDYTGLSREEWLGWGWKTATHPDDLDRSLEKWRAALAAGEPIEQQARYRLANGEYRWFLGRNVPLRDEQGNIVKWYGTLVDVQDRKRAEDELRRSEALLAEAQRLTRVGSWVYKLPDTPEYWSAVSYEIFGIDPANGPPKNIAEFLSYVHPDDRQGLLRVTEEVVFAGQIYDLTYRIITPSGEIRVIREVGTPIYENAILTRFTGAWMDITEQEQRIDALRRSEFYLAEGQRLAHMGSWAFDPSGFYTHWSHELFDIYGMDAAKGAPTLEQYLGAIHSQDREFMKRTIEQMLAEGSGCDLKKRIVRPGGEVRYIRCVGVPVLDDGTLKRIVGTAIDITEQEAMTQELRRREAYLAEAQGLSHTGSFGWRVPTGELLWSDETFRIFQFDRTMKATVELVLQRVHPEDAAFVKQTIERASQDGKDFDFEHRLLMPDGEIKHVHVVARASRDASGELEFIGAVMDVTAAKEAVSRIRLIINTVPGLLWTARSDGWIDFISQRWLDFTGLTLEQGSGWGWEAAYHPDDLEELGSKWRAALAEGKPLEAEARLKRYDGVYRWFLSRAFPLRDGAGGVLGWYGNDIDIHDRKQAEESLQQSEEQWRNVFENNPTMYFMVDAAGTVLAVNTHGAEQLGYRIEELVSQPVLKVFYEGDQEAAQGYVRRCLKQLGQSMSWELRKVRKDGSVLWVRETARAVLRANDPVVLIACEDVTERKHAEQKIREQEAELRQILDAAPQHLAVLGPDGSSLYLNRAALEYHGVSHEEWQDSDPCRFFHPEDWERSNRDVQAAFESGTPVEIEARIARRDGKYFWFFFRYKPLRDEQGRVTRWAVAAIDIEDRKRAEERLQQENVALREEIDKASMFEEIVGTSPALQSVLSRVSKVAPTDSTVLITGETGTGKELVARAIHRRSHRASRAFVSVNCAAIPRDLIASELFGHEKGAFTGAVQRRLGRFELAGGGTIFLDEVGELPVETQIALLRVLQEHEFERVGGTRSIRTDVRVIAATNRDLKAAIAAGVFRSDLFYRLNVFPIEIPALRKRQEDIPLLVEYFIDRFARKSGKNIKSVNKKTLGLLQSYAWPGNIRELQNVIERSVIVCETETFSVDESWISRPPQATGPLSPLDLSERLATQEKEMIEAALRACEGRVFGPAGAAARLGMPRSTLESKIRSLRIDKNRFRA
jgi:PAS domain S-box-containing protein